jgi:hypothetical protein
MWDQQGSRVHWNVLQVCQRIQERWWRYNYRTLCRSRYVGQSYTYEESQGITRTSISCNISVAQWSAFWSMPFSRLTNSGRPCYWQIRRQYCTPLLHITGTTELPQVATRCHRLPERMLQKYPERPLHIMRQRNWPSRSACNCLLQCYWGSRYHGIEFKRYVADFWITQH